MKTLSLLLLSLLIFGCSKPGNPTSEDSMGGQRTEGEGSDPSGGTGTGTGTGSGSGSGSGSGTGTGGSPAAAPTRLAIVANAATITPNTCSGPYRLTFTDNNNNPVATNVARRVLIHFDSNLNIVSRSYSDSQCQTAITGYDFGANTNQKDFWIKVNNPSVIYLLTSDSLFMPEAQYRVQVSAPAGAVLVRSNPYRDWAPSLRYNSSVEKIWYATNLGPVAATNLVFSTPSGGYTYKGGAYPGTGGDCGNTLAAGATCKIVTILSAGDSNSRGNFTSFTFGSISYQSGGVAQSAPFDYQSAVHPKTLALQFDGGPQYAFPQTYPNLPSFSKVISVTNLTNQALTGLNFSLPPKVTYEGGAFPGTRGNCTTTLSAQTACKISLVYTPTAATTAVTFPFLLTANFQLNAVAVQEVAALFLFGSL